MGGKEKMRQGILGTFQQVTFAIFVVCPFFSLQDCIMLFVKLQLEHHSQQLVVTGVCATASSREGRGVWSVHTVSEQEPLLIWDTHVTEGSVLIGEVHIP